MKPKLDKEVCKKCYRYHERIWDEGNDEDWTMGSIICPVDHFNTMLYKGKLVNVEKPMRNLFGAIFGWIETKKVPKWCQFAKEHTKKRETKPPK